MCIYFAIAFQSVDDYRYYDSRQLIEPCMKILWRLDENENDNEWRIQKIIKKYVPLLVTMKLDKFTKHTHIFVWFFT